LIAQYEAKLRILAEHAWDQEVRWSNIEGWKKNFSGSAFDENEEQLYGIFALTRFMYFSKRLIREMLKSLYRDHFESNLLQQIRRSCGGTRDSAVIRPLYEKELANTRFIGVGNPAESGAHLLYYFRQVNYLQKDLFVDFFGAFLPTAVAPNIIKYEQREKEVTRYVFFDDVIGSGTQASQYLAYHLACVRAANPGIDLRLMSLFATSKGLEKLNEKDLFDGKAMCLFELDHSFKAFHQSSRYFLGSPSWFDRKRLLLLAAIYGVKLQPKRALGYKNGQLMIGFSHNTPDNTLPIFWDEGHSKPWNPVFARFDKKYGSSAESVGKKWVATV
jgi:hypothetical protein